MQLPNVLQSVSHVKPCRLVGRATFDKMRTHLRTAAVSGERAARPENSPGPFYVDHTCIDCDACRWMSPSFVRVNQQTAVVDQPTTASERFRAAQALLACPTHSIHLDDKQSGELKAAANSFPFPVDNSEHLYHCGYHSEHSYGAASYLLRRQEGNVLMDSPRFDKALLKNIQALGGAKYMVLSHKDDVADHAEWAAALGLQRIIHADEVTARQGTSECEIKLKGEGPWRLPDGGSDVEMLLTAGHTAGHISLLYENRASPTDNACFSGDHLAFTASGGLSIMRGYNWHSVSMQLQSVHKLRDINFLHLLPGHGRPGKFRDDADRMEQVDSLLAREGYSAPKRQAPAVLAR